MAHDAPPLPGIALNLYQLHWLADKKNSRIMEIMAMTPAEINQYFAYYYEQSKRRGKKS